MAAAEIDEPKGSRNIAAKLASITAHIPMPKQSGRNKFEGYDYATRDDVFNVVRTELAKLGIAYLPSAKLVSFEPAPPTSKGVAQFRTHVAVSLVFIDSQSGEELQITWLGEQVTNTDRGASMATTQAVRTALINMFMLLDSEPDERATPSSSGAPGAVRGADDFLPEPPPAQNAEPQQTPTQKAWSEFRGLLSGAELTNETIQAFIDGTIRDAEARAGNNLEPEDYPLERVNVWLKAMKGKTPEQIKAGVIKAVTA